MVIWNQIGLENGRIITGYPMGPTNAPFMGSVERVDAYLGCCNPPGVENWYHLCKLNWRSATRGLYWFGHKLPSTWWNDYLRWETSCALQRVPPATTLSLLDFIELGGSPSPVWGTVEGGTRPDASGLTVWALSPPNVGKVSRSKNVHAMVLTKGRYLNATRGHVRAFYVRRQDLDKYRLDTFLAYFGSLDAPMRPLVKALQNSNHTELLRSAEVPVAHFGELISGRHAVGLLRICMYAFEEDDGVSGGSGVLSAMLQSVLDGFRESPLTWPSAIMVQSKRATKPAYIRFSRALWDEGYFQVATSDGLFIRQRVRQGLWSSQDLDFIEIGTSDFESVSQSAPSTAKGLAVEAMSVYLHRLQVKAQVAKLNAAVIGTGGLGSMPDFVSMFYVDPADISRLKLPYWMKGCNQVGHPHPEVRAELHRRGLPDLMRNMSIPATTYGQIIRDREIRSVGLLKVDVEGLEGPILRDAQDLCERVRALCPRIVMFETTHMTQHDWSKHHRRFLDLGYMLVNPGMQARDRMYALGITMGLAAKTERALYLNGSYK